MHTLSNSKNCPVTGKHIFVAEKLASSIILNIFSNSLELPQIKVRVIQETFLAGSITSNTLLASSDGSPFILIICRDHLHLIEIDPMRAVYEEPVLLFIVLHSLIILPFKEY